MKSQNRRFWALLVFLLVGAVLINTWERAGEASVARRDLSDFPREVGEWRQVGTDEKFDEAVEKVLRASDYLSRGYMSADQRYASFYVGYYASQRNGATYHSPLNCLPGSGWSMTSPKTIVITPSDGSAPFEANSYVTSKGSDKFLLVYWYEGRGRRVASEYWGKIYTVIDSAKSRRSDGAMVRVLVSMGETDKVAVKTATEFASQIAPLLSAYVPK